MTNTEALVKLGRFMITNAVRFVEDERCNRWARVGQLLTEMGMPFAPRLSELGSEQIATVREAAAIMTGKVAMPETIQVQAPVESRRTRKARMTKAMTKEKAPKVAQPKKDKKTAAKAAPKKAAVKAATNKAAVKAAPKKTAAKEAPKKVGRPAKAVAAKAATDGVIKRGRGRPRKVQA